MEQKTLSRWLKAILVGVGICGLMVYFGIFPEYGKSLVEDYPEFSDRFWLWLVFLWMSGIPCYAALALGWKIVSNIEKDHSFSNDNAKYLKWVAWLAAGDSAFYFAGNLVLFFAGMSHPGILLASVFVVFVGVAVTVVAAALSHLVQKAAVLQEQNDLTI